MSDKAMKSTKSDHSLSTRAVGGCPQTREGPGASVLSDAEVGISDRTDAIVRGLEFLLTHHGAKTRVVQQLKEQLHAYLDTSNGESVWMKRAKHVLTYPLAKYLKNDAPPSPDACFKPSGALRNWMKARLIAFNRKNTHLWYSWLQAKRCALPVSSEEIAGAYRKHYDQLTKPDPCQVAADGSPTEGSLELEEIFLNPVFQRVLAQIRKKVTVKYMKKNNFTDRTPSTSACFEETRSKGGQYGALQGILDTATKNIPEDYSSATDFLDTFAGPSPRYECVDVPILVYPRPDPEFERPVTSIGGRELVRMYQRTYFKGNQLIHGELVTEYELPGRYRWKMLKFVDESRFWAQDANLCATIQAVLEPLKIRIISKGPAIEYYRMKPLQETIHNVMRKMPCFRLIGRPMCPTDLLDLIPTVDDELFGPIRTVGDRMWISVDYSAATDGLSSEYGLRILHSILRDLPVEERLRASKVLGSHRLFYPVWNAVKEKWETPEERGVQTNGQLMGGILSFPILCLANLGVYLRVMNAKEDDALSKVLVNGDDMLYVGSEQNWDRHIVVARNVGLEMSVGKAYKHKVYANANSTSFHCDLREMESTPWQINYLNAGLFFGQHKVQRKEAGTAESHHDNFESCIANINTIVNGSLPGKQCAVLADFLSNNKEKIDAESLCTLRAGRRLTQHHRNLFLPIDQGGMGVEAPPGWKFFVKPIEHRLSKSLEVAIMDCRPYQYRPIERSVERISPWIRRHPDAVPPEFALSRGRTRRVSVVPRQPTWYNGSTSLY